jgi:ABC-type Na+ efflux pump permease subunit
MNHPGKMAGAVLVGIIFIMVILIFGSMLLGETDTHTGAAEEIGFQLWELRPLELLVLSVMMFGAVLGILKLVGGEFRWN